MSNDFRQDRTFWEELFQEVTALETTRSSGVKLGIGGEALQSLRETKITFGNPRNELIRLTEELFQQVGLELSPIHKQQIKTNYDFYYMTLTVSMQPGRGTQFTCVECRLDFAPKGEREPIVHTLFPTPEWKELLKIGLNFNVGLDGQFDWKAALPENAQFEALPGTLNARVATQQDFKAVLTIPNYAFKFGASDIAASGQGNSECFWRIDKPDLQKAQTAKFGVVFKVPKGTTEIKLTGLVAVEPDFRWLTSKLSVVFEELSQRFQQYFVLQDHQPPTRQAIGESERWTLALPE